MRKIILKYAPNTRELGGLVTLDGRTIAHNRLIRSGELSKIDIADAKVLTEQYNLCRVVDFRTDEERTTSPDVIIDNVEYIINPILGKAILGVTHQSENSKTDLVGLVKAGIDHMEQTGLTVVQYMQKIYQRFVTDEHCLKQYAKFFDILINAQQGATLWHCSAGKDRVGAGTALLLLALGVDKQTIIADYMLTGESNHDKVDHIVSMLDGDQRIAQLTKQIMGVDERYIEAIFDVIENNYTSVQEFFSKAMHYDQNKIDKLRQMYLV